VIVFSIFALAWLIAEGWQRLSIVLRIVSLLAISTGLVLIILFIRTKDVFALLFDPYWEKGMLVTAGVLFLAVFAQWRFPKLTFATILVILLLLGALLAPPYLSLLFIGLLVGNALASYNFYPSDCCDIVGRDDLVAIDWIDKNLPRDARILISSTELRVLPIDAPHGAAGGDAGTWITPLTGRVTIPLSYQSDFSQPAIFATLCQMRIGYLYVGETGAVFNNGLIAPHPEIYRVLLAMPATKVYQVVGCPSQ
jgi:hypothetical protein